MIILKFYTRAKSTTRHNTRKTAHDDREDDTQSAERIILTILHIPNVFFVSR